MTSYETKQKPNIPEYRVRKVKKNQVLTTLINVCKMYETWTWFYLRDL